MQSHLVYTHGDGVVIVPADAAAPDGRPDVDALADELDPQRTELYFADGMRDWYAIVGTKRTEQGGKCVRRRHRHRARLDVEAARPVAEHGRDRAAHLRRAHVRLAVALSTRRARAACRRVAPFLSFDSNPYPVITDDHVVWVVDGYTTSSRYPVRPVRPDRIAPVVERPRRTARSTTSTPR